MENLAIARIFSEIADLLEIKNENPFKIRAYRNAADTIVHTADRLSDCSDEQLRAIGGIGKDLASKIREICETGDALYHRELLQEFPPTILDLLHLQGVGPKTVAQLYGQLGIRTLEELELACKNGRIRGLKGMGAKKEALILKALEESRQREGRHLMSETVHAATALLDYLQERFPVASLTQVGSVRRGTETSGDIDILATGADTSLMAAFTAYPQVERILAQGETKSSVKLLGGIQADLRLVAVESRGAALQYFTGSKTHNIALRDRAISRGFKLNEYGLFLNADDSRIAGATEEEIYEALGLMCVPPELRENRGELEAAERRALPVLVELRDIRGDLHAHTTETDGRDDIEAMATAAKEAGLEYLAITDHSQALAMERTGRDPRARARQAHPRGRPAHRRHHAPGGHRVRHPRRRQHGSLR